MKQYKLKRGFKPDIDRIYSVMEECFSEKIFKNEIYLETSHGAMSKIKVWIANKMLCVDTISDKTISDDKIILQTNKDFREFLYKATGYTTKERMKNASKDVD